MTVTIDCEICGGEGGIWKGGTIPVACPAECDNGQVLLEGDDATDELERREVAKRKAAERRATQATATYPSARLTPEERREVEQRAGVAQLAAEGRSGSLARPASPAAPKYRLYEAYTKNERTGKMTAAGAVIAVGLAEDGTQDLDRIFCVDRGETSARPISRGGWIYTHSGAASVVTRAQYAAEIAVLERALAHETPATIPAPVRTAWPFDNALEASRDNRARRTNAHPETVAAFAYLTTDLKRGAQTPNGGWVK